MDTVKKILSKELTGAKKEIDRIKNYIRISKVKLNKLEIAKEEIESVLSKMSIKE